MKKKINLKCQYLQVKRIHVFHLRGFRNYLAENTTIK